MLLSWSIDASPRAAESLVQDLFERCGVTALYVSPTPVLDIYASGRVTGCAVNCGHSDASAAVVIEVRMTYVRGNDFALIM